MVTPASAESSVTDSRRGLASRLSPAQTASKKPERSACDREVDEIRHLDGAEHDRAIGEDQSERRVCESHGYLPV